MPTTRIPYGVLDGRYVNAAGDTMLGELTLAGAPTLDLHAATKKYVDDADAAFLRKDGSVALTANWDIGDTRKILADELAARDSDGLKLYDDSGAGIFIEDGGNVGVGTTNPREKFEIMNGFLRFGSNVDSPVGFKVERNGTDIGWLSTANGRLTISASNDKHISIEDNAGNGIFIKDGGFIGIGTTNPGDRVTIGPWETPAITAQADATIGIYGDGAAFFRGRDVTNDIEFIMGTSALGEAFAGSMTPHHFSLRANNETVMRLISGTNRVGIGTTGPDRKLDVFDASNPQLRLTHTDGSVYTDFQTVSDGYLYINPSGNRVGIRTSSPSQALEVAGSVVIGAHDTYHMLYVNRYSSSGYAYIAAGDTDRDMGVGLGFQYRNANGSPVTGFSMSSNGKVGIGVTQASRKLEIIDPSAPQLRLTNVLGTHYIDFETNNIGSLIITPSGSRITIAKELEVDGSFNHDGSTFGVFGVTPASRVAAYTVTNAITDRSFDADNTTIAELADVVATIISDLKTYGFFQ